MPQDNAFFSDHGVVQRDLQPGAGVLAGELQGLCLGAGGCDRRKPGDFRFPVGYLQSGKGQVGVRHAILLFYLKCRDTIVSVSSQGVFKGEIVKGSVGDAEVVFCGIAPFKIPGDACTPVFTDGFPEISVHRIFPVNDLDHIADLFVSDMYDLLILMICYLHLLFLLFLS